jgi:hypothetical protein
MQEKLRDRGTLILITAALASMLAACGGSENSSTDTAAPGESAAESPAGNIEQDTRGSTGSLTLGDETIVFTVEMCTNPGGGTYAFSGSSTGDDGKTVNIMVRGFSGQSQVVITMGPRDSADAWEWRGGTETISASIEGGVLTASGVAVGLDPSTGAFTEQTKNFSLSGPCVNFAEYLGGNWNLFRSSPKSRRANPNWMANLSIVRQVCETVARSFALR